MKKSISVLALFMLSMLLVSCFKHKELDIVVYTTKETEKKIENVNDLNKIDRIIKETSETVVINLDETVETEELVSSDEENIDEIFGSETVVETENEVTEVQLNEAALEVAKNSESTLDMTPAPYIDPAVIKAQLTEDVKTGYWVYGKSPITWVYVRPNTKLVSNYRPNGSANFSIRSNANSGDKGCFLPILTGTENASEYYEGRFYVFGDSSHDPNSFRYVNSLSDLVYKNVKVDEILRKKYDLVKNTNGLLETNGTYINIVYVSELESIINE